MSLVAYAKRELELAGLFDKDSDYNGDTGRAVMELIEVFSKQGHSGMSASMTREIFYQLSQFKPLGEFTPSIEDAIEYHSGEFQSKRRHDVFSKDGGKTWYSIDTEETWGTPAKLKAEYSEDLANRDDTLIDSIIEDKKS